jgi:hypothetical protein
MQYEYSPMQLAEITDFSFLKEWDTIRIMPEGYNEEGEREELADPTFTRSKGGTAEREELISQIQLPDLYLLAEEIIRPGNRILKENRERFADMLIETWHLAHDMKRHLQSNS